MSNKLFAWCKASSCHHGAYFLFGSKPANFLCTFCSRLVAIWSQVLRLQRNRCTHTSGHIDYATFIPFTWLFLLLIVCS